MHSGFDPERTTQHHPSVSRRIEGRGPRSKNERGEQDNGSRPGTTKTKTPPEAGASCFVAGAPYSRQLQPCTKSLKCKLNSEASRQHPWLAVNPAGIGPIWKNLRFGRPFDVQSRFAGTETGHRQFWQKYHILWAIQS